MLMEILRGGLEAGNYSRSSRRLPDTWDQESRACARDTPDFNTSRGAAPYGAMAAGHYATLNR
ncbi:MAG TPA: hypothetical protein VGD21_13635, partial [Lysobacter sp.]